MLDSGKARWLTVVLSGLLIVAACDDGEPSVPTRIELLSGDAQTAPVATIVPTAPTVRVLDQKGKPVARIPVVFTVTAGGGAIANPNVTTDAKGVAQATGWTLGTTAGVNTIAATSPRISTASVTITANGGAGTATKLKVLTQPAAAAQNRSPLGTQPIIQVADQYGNAVSTAGTVVTVQVAGVGVQNAQATTDATGAARFTAITLQGSVGTYTLRFAAPNLGTIDASNATVLSAGNATRLGLGAGFPGVVISGSALTPAPVVEVWDDDQNLVAAGSFTVSVALASGAGSLGGGTPIVTQGGRATFTSLSYTGTGTFRLRFLSPGLNDAVSNDLQAQAVAVCNTTLLLNFTLGEMQRFSANDASTPQCLQFNLAQNRDQQFLVLFESDPGVGDYSSALFPGTGAPSNGVTVTVTTGPVPNIAPQLARTAEKPLPPGMLNSWDFGAGEIYEYQPRTPATSVSAPMLLQRGRTLSLNSATAAPNLGDTIVVFLEGIGRLGIASGNQRAVIRHITNDLIFAEDVRLGTLTRQNGQTNKPLTTALMDSIAQAYSNVSKQQADFVFSGRFNRATEAQTPARIIAVHTLMPSDNIWGYTYASTNVFAWDYWVGTDGTTRGPNQHVLRNAHNLFMHEVAHTRHWGLVERSTAPSWGNLWLVEGFARFSERLPTASYLLRTTDPSRISNLVLPLYPEWAPSYFRDDVPTYLNAGSSFLGGYQQSSYIFDYLADQVAAAGGNWRAALAAFITTAGNENSLDATVNTVLPGTTFRTLLTRARVALYTDDIGTQLPPWTQYLQYQLRASRPPGTSGTPVDPRTIWPHIIAGIPYSDARIIPAGAAFGYVIDGVGATASTRFSLTFPPSSEIGLSITRIR